MLRAQNVKKIVYYKILSQNMKLTLEHMKICFQNSNSISEITWGFKWPVKMTPTFLD